MFHPYLYTDAAAYMIVLTEDDFNNAPFVFYAENFTSVKKSIKHWAKIWSRDGWDYAVEVILPNRSITAANVKNVVRHNQNTYAPVLRAEKVTDGEHRVRYLSVVPL